MLINRKFVTIRRFRSLSRDRWKKRKNKHRKFSCSCLSQITTSCWIVDTTHRKGRACGSIDSSFIACWFVVCSRHWSELRIVWSASLKNVTAGLLEADEMYWFCHCSKFEYEAVVMAQLFDSNSSQFVQAVTERASYSNWALGRAVLIQSCI